MKKLLFSFVFIAFAVVAFAQSTTIDVVSFANGDILKGTIVKRTADFIRVRTADGCEFVYPSSEVLSISQEKAAAKEKAKTNNTSFNWSSGSLDGRGPQKGYRGFVDFGYTFSDNEKEVGTYGVETVHGFQINDRFFVGAGAAAFRDNDAFVSVPIFADFRVNAINHSVSPFFDFKAGYDLQGSVCLSPGTGFRIGTGSRFAINVSVSYLALITMREYNNFTFKLGVEF